MIFLFGFLTNAFNIKLVEYQQQSASAISGVQNTNTNNNSTTFSKSNEQSSNNTTATTSYSIYQDPISGIKLNILQTG